MIYNYSPGKMHLSGDRMMGICVYQSVFMFVLTLNLESKPRPSKPRVHTHKKNKKNKIKQAHTDVPLVATALYSWKLKAICWLEWI